MGLFDKQISKLRRPDVPKDLFIEDDEADPDNNELAIPTTISSEPVNQNTMDTPIIPTPQIKLQGREAVDDFLKQDFEPDGYQDALVNPDRSYCDSNKQILRYKLELVVNEALTFYTEKLRACDFLIQTRADSGMLDTVKEVQSEKDNVIEEVEKIRLILSEAKQNMGVGHLIVLSYERGFQRGLAAITQTKLKGTPS